MVAESEKAFLQLVRDVSFPVKGMLIASQVRQANFGIARNALGEIATIVQDITDPDEQRANVMAMLMQIWTCGRVDFCQEALDTVIEFVPPEEHSDINGVFSFSLEYIRKGRDPYFLEALQPDIRSATEKLVSFIDHQGRKTGEKI